MLRKSRGGAVVEFDEVEKPEHPDQPELRISWRSTNRAGIREQLAAADTT
jgi:hypothetical protein